jgi:hypothetical protein
MSTCPNSDGYSVYLDGEIPKQYEAQYRQHLEDCLACKKNYENMQSMTRILHEDAEAIQLTEAELNESFIKLQRLVQFQENTKYTKRNDGMRTLKHALPAIAAALIIGIFIPLKFKQTESDAFTPTLHTINPTARLITTKGIIAEGSLSEALQKASYTANKSSLEFNQNLVNSVDIFRPATLNEPSNIQIKIFDKTDSFQKINSDFYQASYYTKGRFLP